MVILRRKQVGNPDDYFNKNFAEYEEGFESKGKVHTALTHILLIVSMDSIFYNSSVQRQNFHSALSKLWKKAKWQNIFAGEIWLGLKKIHELTSGGGYSLQITMTDFDQNSYVAYYHRFQVVMMIRMI